jgi:hypothetical protein
MGYRQVLALDPTQLEALAGAERIVDILPHATTSQASDGHRLSAQAHPSLPNSNALSWTIGLLLQTVARRRSCRAADRGAQTRRLRVSFGDASRRSQSSAIRPEQPRR